MSTPEPERHDIVRRSNETIAIKPSRGRITTVGRRLFNCLLYAAQQIEKVEPQEVYRIPLRELAELADFTSKDMKSLKECLVELNSTTVEWNSESDLESQWGTSGMISDAIIIAQPGKASIVEWTLPRKIKAALLNPTFYTKLSLQIHSGFRSGASSALYEICSRYATNPGGLTMREPWMWWRPRITGSLDEEQSEEESSYKSEYKYFKRDVLKGAISEVNRMAAEISIELIEHKNGRSVQDLQFRVRQKAPAQTAAQLDLPLDGELINRLIKLGMSPADATKLLGSNSADFVRRTIKYTEDRASNKTLPELRSKAAFFKRAIKEKWADTQPEAESKVPPRDPAQERAENRTRTLEKLMTRRIREAIAHYKELSQSEQRDLCLEFCDAHPDDAISRDVRRRSISTKIAEVAFGKWYTIKLHGDPTDEELLTFMLENAS